MIRMYSPSWAHERINVRRKRFQEGSLQVRSHGSRKMWAVLYRERGVRKYHTLGYFSELTKTDAQVRQAEFMQGVNARVATAPEQGMTFGSFLTHVALPFYRAKWKASTASTTENRITFHFEEFGSTRLDEITMKRLQEFLKRKATSLSKSMVAHLRWDLRLVFKLALSEGYVQRDPTAALYTPKEASVAITRAMSGEEVEQYIGALETRESVIAYLAIFVGMRPGEILGIQRQHVAADCRSVTIAQRVYRGAVDTPKTNSSRRVVAIPTKTAKLLKAWMGMVGSSRNAWVFASENPLKPMWRDNVWYRYMKPRVKPLGLGWANFQALRRTHASLGHDAGIDPKTSADQRGHGIGVALDVYTKAALSKRAEAAEKLEISVFAA